ncbi:unnamed protein product [Mycena citricolor]|uniref:Cyclin N-terminal domain-containing protein n=1 Tax=Mycena citricolor TaxID=2018698 RepID=A0AAD2H9C9_9AGAR|nr:unnamed protein product [Mycena citricolor]
MASRIPIRRAARTQGAENENAVGTAKPTHGPARAKVLGKTSGSTTASRPHKSSHDTTVAATKPAREPRDDDALAKRKREALRDKTDVRSANMKGKEKADRKILGLPKKTAAADTVAPAARAPLRVVSAAGAAPARDSTAVPAAGTRIREETVLRKVSRRPSLLPVPQQDKESELEVLADEEDNEAVEPSPKRLRTSSVAPEDMQAEEQVAAELDAVTDDEEADPDGDLWEDLDAQDADDVLMVSEYVIDIQRYLRDVELKTMANPRYMSAQGDLTWSMRGMLNEWLMQVHLRFRLLPETLFLCSNLIDRFLSARIVSPTKLQLVGMGCLLLACKFEETVSPSISSLVTICDNAFDAAAMRQAEQHILRTLDWDLSYPSPMHFLRRISKADGYNATTRTLAKYLAEISCIDHRLISVPPSMLAAAAMWLARLSLGEDSWTPTLAHFAMYRESEIIPVANVMIRYVLQPIKHMEFYKKYAGKKNMKVSVYVRQWAIGQWGEGTRIDLQEELPALKRSLRTGHAVQVLAEPDENDATAAEHVLDEEEAEA